MAAFVGSLIVTIVMVVVVRRQIQRRPVGASLTWGEAMAAATFVFFFMFWAYGVVPHQWLVWADNELKWRSDAYLVGPASTGTWNFGDWRLIDFRNVPFNVSLQAVRDLIAVVIYGALLAGHVALWNMWQGRGDAAARRQKAIEERTTAYGRPLARKV